jgi:hypothetical protein
MPASGRLSQYSLPTELFLKEVGVAECHPIGGTKFNEEMGVHPAMELMENKEILRQLRF